MCTEANAAQPHSTDYVWAYDSGLMWRTAPQVIKFSFIGYLMCSYVPRKFQFFQLLYIQINDSTEVQVLQI